MIISRTLAKRAFEEGKGDSSAPKMLGAQARGTDLDSKNL